MYKILSNDDLALVVGESSDILELYLDHCYTIKDFKERINRYNSFIKSTIKDYSINVMYVFWGSNGEPDLTISKKNIKMHMDYDNELKVMCSEIQNNIIEANRK